MASAIVDFCCFVAYIYNDTGNIKIFVSSDTEQRSHKKIAMGIAVLFLALFSFIYFGDFISSSFEYGKGYLKDAKEYTYIWEIIIGLIETFETIYVLKTYRTRCKKIREIFGINLFICLH